MRTMLLTASLLTQQLCGFNSQSTARGYSRCSDSKQQHHQDDPTQHQRVTRTGVVHNVCQKPAGGKAKD